MRYIILIVVILVAVLAGFAALKFSGQDTTQLALPVSAPSIPGAPGSDVATVDVLVARSDIPSGTQLNDTLVDKQPWPKHLVLEGFIVAGTPEATVDGKVTRTELKAREPLMVSKISNAGEGGFIAATLEPGMRMVTIAVDTISGVAGYIFPGDHVDVLVAHNIPAEMQARSQGTTTGLGSKPDTAEVLLANIKVLAVELRQTTQQSNEQQATQQVAQPPTNVSLEVTQEDAKRLRLAEKNGTLSLALRPVKDESDTSVGEAVDISNVTRVEGTTRRGAIRAASPTGGDEVIIIRGVKIENEGKSAKPSLENIQPLSPPDISPSAGKMEN